MSNNNKYHFDDFTEVNYRRLLNIIKDNNFIFSNFIDYKDKGIRYVIMRHDIDFSVHRALSLARIEYYENIKSTYFVHLHSEYYNLLEKDITTKLLNIISLGHDIGLHFDTHYYNINNENDLNEFILFEKHIIKSIFDVDVSVLSFHNTNSFVLKCNKPSYAGLVNTYSDAFIRHMPYCSDSYGYWRYQRLEEVVCNPGTPSLHILIHPELWTPSKQSPLDRIWRCIDGRAENCKAGYLELLEANGQPVITEGALNETA